MKYYLEEINQAQSEYEESTLKLEAFEKEYEACKDHHRKLGWDLRKLKTTNLPPGYTMKDTSSWHNHRYEGGGWELYHDDKIIDMEKEGYFVDDNGQLRLRSCTSEEDRLIELAHELYMKEKNEKND